MGGKVEKKQLKNKEGDVLYEGFASSRKDLIRRLLADRSSMAGVMLDGADLSGIDLTGVDFRRASLVGVDFRGATLKGAHFNGANLQGAKLQGTRLDKASFESANLSHAELVGARATAANFCGANLNGADLTDITASSAQFRHVSAEKTSFAGAELINADFRDAKLIECDFRGAKLEHRIFGGEDETVQASVSRHMPNRTAGALVVGCHYGPREAGALAGSEPDDTKLCKTVPAMEADRRAARATKFLLWSTTTLAAVATVEHGSEVVAPFLASVGHFTAGFGFVAVMGGVYLLKEKVIDYARDKLAEGLNTVIRRGRECMTQMERVGVHRAHLAVLVARNASLEPIRMALDAKQPEAQRRGWWGAVKSFACELGNVIMCDRRHLASALALISARRHHHYDLPHDIVLMRCHGTHGDDARMAGPCVVSFLANGRTTATWSCEDKRHVTTSYDREGNYLGCWDTHGAKVDPVERGLSRAHTNRLEAMFEFEAALLTDHRLDKFDYPRTSHFVEDGRDGSLLVRRLSDRRVDNPHEGSPALLRPDNSGIIAKNGSRLAEVASIVVATGPRL